MKTFDSRYVLFLWRRITLIQLTSRRPEFLITELEPCTHFTEASHQENASLASFPRAVLTLISLGGWSCGNRETSSATGVTGVDFGRLRLALLFHIGLAVSFLGANTTVQIHICFP